MKSDVWLPQMPIYTTLSSPIQIFSLQPIKKTAGHRLSTWNVVINNKLRSIKNWLKPWPRLGWIDAVKVALGNRGMTVEAARQCAKDREE